MSNKNDKLSNLDKKLLNIIWKPVVVNNITTDYEVSDSGHIRNKIHNRLLQGSHDKRGYITVSIYVNKKLKTKLLHRLVATAFIPNPENKETVNHKDGNKENNAVSNLEWATHLENITHAIQTGLRDLRGMKASSNIYTDEQVHQVCKMLEEGKGSRYIAKVLNVNPNLPRRILYLGKWTHISSQYNLPTVCRVNKDLKDKKFKIVENK